MSLQKEQLKFIKKYTAKKVQAGQEFTEAQWKLILCKHFLKVQSILLWLMKLKGRHDFSKKIQKNLNKNTETKLEKVNNIYINLK